MLVILKILALWAFLKAGGCYETVQTEQTVFEEAVLPDGVDDPRSKPD